MVERTKLPHRSMEFTTIAQNVQKAQQEPVGGLAQWLIATKIVFFQNCPPKSQVFLKSVCNFSRIIHKLRELLWFPSWISPESIELQWILWDFNQTTYTLYETSHLKGYTGRSWECRFRARKNAADRPHLLDQPAVSLLPTTASLQQHGRCLGNQEFWERVVFHGNLRVTPPKPTPSLESTALIQPNWLK